MENRIDAYIDSGQEIEKGLHDLLVSMTRAIDAHRYAEGASQAEELLQLRNAFNSFSESGYASQYPELRSLVWTSLSRNTFTLEHLAQIYREIQFILPVA